MEAAEHWQAWLDRYGDTYSSDEERRAAYNDFKANLATLSNVFDGPKLGVDYYSMDPSASS